VHSIYADEFFKWVYSPFLTLFILVRHFFQRVYLDGPSFRSFSHMPLIHFIFSSGIIPAFFYSMEFINIVYALPLAVFTDGFQFLDLCLRGLRPSPRGLRPSCYDTPAISYSSWDYCFFATIGFFSSWLSFFQATLLNLLCVCYFPPLFALARLVRGECDMPFHPSPCCWSVLFCHPFMWGSSRWVPSVVYYIRVDIAGYWRGMCPILIIVLFEAEDHNLIHRLLWHGLWALPSAHAPPYGTLCALVIGVSIPTMSITSRVFTVLFYLSRSDLVIIPWTSFHGGAAPRISALPLSWLAPFLLLIQCLH